MYFLVVSFFGPLLKKSSTVTAESELTVELKEDIAAEDDTSLNAKEYDTDLGYTGAVTFGSNWCYFAQIKSVSTKEGSDVDVAIEQENEWWK